MTFNGDNLHKVKKNIHMELYDFQSAAQRKQQTSKPSPWQRNNKRNESRQKTAKLSTNANAS